MASSAPVKIGNQRFTADLTRAIRRPLATMRQMVDSSNEPGEQSFRQSGSLEANAVRLHPWGESAMVRSTRGIVSTQASHFLRNAHAGIP
jgi:hypothetical protein